MKQITRIPKKAINKWIELLRSGEYKQGIGYLYDGKSFCCLGIAAISCGLTKEAIANSELPSDSSLENIPTWLKDIDTDFYNRAKRSLTCANDSKDFSFQEIADLLQAVYIERVLEEKNEKD